MDGRAEKKEPLKMVEAIQVIHISIFKGDGSESNPARIVDQYWAFNGELLAEKDPATD